MIEWRLIETAPKNVVITAAAKGAFEVMPFPYPVKSKWVRGWRFEGDCYRFRWWAIFSGAWCADFDGRWVPYTPQPTHWTINLNPVDEIVKSLHHSQSGQLHEPFAPLTRM